ncbi:protein PIN-LIKES 7-like isoform X3 [Musa acuminata AAA Group]|uniref:protein PIN-LIKES 7-like isoform X3 n=1 Tax=Musa acuminata AAA Group TaxID=214697 RepID=UPI0031E45EC7
MEFWSLLMVASRPVLQVLLVSLIGAFLASGYVNILSSNARRDVNKIVFVVFIPALVFASLAKTVTAKDIISWWFMPVNIGITFLIGGILGWAAVKMLKLEHNLQALVIASCSAGNLGALPLIIVPAICDEDGNPFGLSKICRVQGISYASFSMVVGNLFIWTHTYSLIRKSVSHSSGNHGHDVLTRMNKNPETNRKTRMFDAQEEQDYDDRRALLLPPSDTSDRTAEHRSKSQRHNYAHLGEIEGDLSQNVGGIVISTNNFCDNWLRCGCYTMVKGIHSWRNSPTQSCSRFHDITRGWHHTLHDHHSRWQSNRRTAQVHSKASGNRSHHLCAVRHPSSLWHCCGHGCRSSRFPATISAVLLYPTYTIYSPPCHEYRYNGTIV